MVVIVGDGLDAHHGYVKKAFYENRFRDENGVTYTDPEVDQFENENDVPGGLQSSPVAHDGTTRKKTGPPRLMDLAGLSSLLAKKGFGAKNVLDTYQKMYEAQVVSYPRTEDKFISIEQFNELLPSVDAIAGVVGVDPAALSHRGPRTSHIKAGGAHGANRPGPNVPPSLAAVEKAYGELGKEIYELLAKNYLTMLAPDYEYDQHRGHVEKYPSFVGTLNVPAVLGWKGVFVVDEEDQQTGDQPEGVTALGSVADPFVHEGFPPRPPHPTMGWLMKQLEKRSVGTGATRTSTYAEVTNNSAGKALMVEKRGKITLSAIGELNHRILPGTHIGDLTITEQVFEQMAQIEAGTGEAADYLSLVADLVRRDLATMTANARTLSGELTARMGKAGVTRETVEMIELPPELHFTHAGTVVTRAKRVFGGHRFTDTEVAALLAGRVIEIVATSAKSGKTFTCTGKLEPGVRDKDGKQYPHVSFNPQFEERAPRTDLVSGVWKGKPVTFKGRGWGANDHWPGKDFTEQEVAALLAGETIEFDATSKTGKTYRARGALAASTFQGSKTFGFKLKFEDRKSTAGTKKRTVRR